ncbi:MAG TPA: TonB-dependent receptor plug domain-containing protein [Draconibacterium sp.]|nr:TonB-dependent receptor plug domain-containing protein [Draconibacterium sp.]
MAKTVWFAVFMFLVLFQVTAQTAKKIIVKVQKTSLSKVLLDLKENYGIQFAFDNDILSKYMISVNRTFQSEEEALSYLLKNLPLEMEKSGEVFIIIPVSENTVAVQPVATTQIAGQVLESQTFEPLPYSYIHINNKYIQTDQQGNFNFTASAGTTFDLQISHLGYYIYDTVITESVNNKFLLNPQIEKIAQVDVLGNLVEQSTLIGDKAGRMKVNHRIAPVLPGHGDNSVFNLLRLMPGILAAGEQSTEMLIWGSYESQSKIQFDGYTVFGLKNFNDNISVVNPLMVKNIEVLKGGYEARYGDRIGGIVDITGKNGTMQKPAFTFNINSTTINSMAEIPVSKKSSILAAYRQTYYQLYDPASLELFGRNSRQKSKGSALGNNIDFVVSPDYTFRDANLKYVYRGDNGSQLSLNLYGGGDKFDYDLDGQIVNTIILRSEAERNRQLGSSALFVQPWKNGNTTNISAGYSVFERLADEQNQTENTRNGKKNITKSISSDNNVDEINVNAEHTVSLLNGHNLIFGLGAINNNVKLSRKSFDNKLIDLDSHSPRIVSYLQDELPVGSFMELKSGLRVIYATYLKRWYAEPRISASVKLSEEFKLNAAWGLYNQFMSKTSIVDSSLNYAYFWTNSDEVNIPVLRAQHWVGGISYFKNGLTVSAETYFKPSSGITRFYNGSNRFERGFYAGDARSTGLDIFIKKEYKRQMAWISYSLGKTEEHFPFYVRDEYKPAPHDQRHELKIAGIFNYKSFYFSANYVYGSGFNRYDFETERELNPDKDYKRLDAAVVYKFRPGKVKTEVGISVLNVFNTENVKYSNLRSTTVDDINLVNIYTDAVPFTPTLFLNIEF